MVLSALQFYYLIIFNNMSNVIERSKQYIFNADHPGVFILEIIYFFLVRIHLEQNIYFCVSLICLYRAFFASIIFF